MVKCGRGQAWRQSRRSFRVYYLIVFHSWFWIMLESGMAGHTLHLSEDIYLANSHWRTIRLWLRNELCCSYHCGFSFVLQWLLARCLLINGECAQPDHSPTSSRTSYERQQILYLAVHVYLSTFLFCSYSLWYVWDNRTTGQLLFLVYWKWLELHQASMPFFLNNLAPKISPGSSSHH